MSDHDHAHHHAGHGHGHNHPRKKPFHKDWRLWVVVALMLLAIVVYILTIDESMRPWRSTRPTERHSTFAESWLPLSIRS